MKKWRILLTMMLVSGGIGFIATSCSDDEPRNKLSEVPAEMWKSFYSIFYVEDGDKYLPYTDIHVTKPKDYRFIVSHEGGSIEIPVVLAEENTDNPNFYPLYKPESKVKDILMKELYYHSEPEWVSYIYMGEEGDPYVMDSQRILIRKTGDDCWEGSEIKIEKINRGEYYSIKVTLAPRDGNDSTIQLMGFTWGYRRDRDGYQPWGSNPEEGYLAYARFAIVRM